MSRKTDHPGELRGLRGLIQRVGSFSFVRNAGVLGFSELAMAVLLLAQGIVVARWLGPEQYGIATLIMSYPAILFSFFDAKTSTATVKFLGEFSSQGRRDASRAMCRLSYLAEEGIALLTLAVVALTAGWAEARIVHTPGAASLMVIYSAAYLFRAPAGPSRAVLSLRGRFRTMAVAEVVTTAMGTTAVIGLVIAGWGVAGVVIGNMASRILSGILLGVLAHREICSAWGGAWMRAPWRALKGKGREIIRFLAFTELTELFNLLGKQADVVILGYFGGPVQAGYYRLAKKLTGIVSVVVKPLQTVLYPRLAKHAGAGRTDAFRQTLARYIFWVGLPLAGCVCLFLPTVPWVIEGVVGSEYLPAAWPAQLLLLNAASWLAFSWFRPWAQAVGRVQFLFGQVVAVNLICVIGYLFTAAHWGATGLAAATLLGAGVIGPCIGLFGYLRWMRKGNAALQGKTAPVEVAAGGHS